MPVPLLIVALMLAVTAPLVVPAQGTGGATHEITGRPGQRLLGELRAVLQQR